MNNPKVKLLSHASLLIEVDGKKIITDPWYFGTAFNDGWELSCKPNLDEIKTIISDVDIIWISHEHPDHLHFPTLKWISEFVKKDVTIYFQKTNSDKVFTALQKFGFENFCQMQHLKKISISSDVQIMCYAHRHLDSCLGVFVGGKFWLLNINDTELNSHDMNIISKRFGAPYVLYNQFSIAGSDGIVSHLATDAKEVLEKMVGHHKLLKAQLTVPFASFVRFARKDNQFMNEYANTVFDTKEKFAANNSKMLLQSIGGDYLEWQEVDQPAINERKIDEQGVTYFSLPQDKNHDENIYEVINKVELKRIIEDRINEWQKVTNKFVFNFLKLDSVKFCITDWDNEVWELDFKTLKFLKISVDKYDISIASQPLFQAFKFPFGIQTLGVSGRYRFTDEYKDVPAMWKKIRVLSSLYNADIFLSFKSIFSFTVLRWIWARKNGLMSQVFQQLTRFSKM
jgi:UDP-MurNAc hydroxylase